MERSAYLSLSLNRGASITTQLVTFSPGYFIFSKFDAHSTLTLPLYVMGYIAEFATCHEHPSPYFNQRDPLKCKSDSFLTSSPSIIKALYVVT